MSLSTGQRPDGIKSLNIFKTYLIEHYSDFMVNKNEIDIIAHILEKAKKGANTPELRSSLNHKQFVHYAYILTRSKNIGDGNGTGKKYQTTPKGIYTKKKIDEFKNLHSHVFNSSMSCN